MFTVRKKILQFNFAHLIEFRFLFECLFPCLFVSRRVSHRGFKPGKRSAELRATCSYLFPPELFWSRFEKLIFLMQFSKTRSTGNSTIHKFHFVRIGFILPPVLWKELSRMFTSDSMGTSQFGERDMSCPPCLHCFWRQLCMLAETVSAA